MFTWFRNILSNSLPVQIALTGHLLKYNTKEIL